MTFTSNARTASDFRAEVVNHLQRNAVAAYNRKRSLERLPRPLKSDIRKAEIEFHTYCDLLDFYKAMFVEGEPYSQEPKP